MAVEITPLSPVTGAAITGIDLHEPVDDATLDRLRAALFDRCVLVFPDQHLDPAAQDAFGRRWGEPLVVPYLRPYQVDGYPALLRVENMGKQGTLTENWHFDSAYFQQPPPLALLAAQQLPAMGGDTMWANQYAAHDALSPRMRALLADLRIGFTGTTRDDDGNRVDTVAHHPVIRVHPFTGRRALAAGRPESAPTFEAMTPTESLPLLQFLYDHCSQPEFVYRHRWHPGDVVLWDNRGALHYAVHDYGDATRLLHRMTIVDDGSPPTAG